MMTGKGLSWVVAYTSIDRNGNKGPYTLKDVEALNYNIKLFYPEINFVVFSNEPETARYCDTYIPLEKEWSKGWWSILECFRFKASPVVFSGLDTILMRNIDDLLERVLKMHSKEFMMIEPFNPNYRERGWKASGIQCWNGDFEFLLKRFDRSHNKYLNCMKMEEEYTTKALEEADIDILVANDYVDVSSYKRHYTGQLGGKRKRPDKIQILCFHGEPRPSQINDPYLLSFRRA